MAFYFISGLCYNKSTAPLRVRIGKKIINLGWILLTFSILGICFHYLFLAIGMGNKVPLWKMLIGNFYSDGIVGVGVTKGFWFVRELLYVSVLYIVFERLVGKYLTFFIWLSLAILVTCITDSFYMAQTLGRASWGGCFYSLGAIVSMYSDTINEKLSQTWYLFVGLISIILTSIIAQFNIPVLLYKYEYGIIALFFVTGILGSNSLYFVSKFIAKCKWLEYIGKNSIVYLFVQFYILMIPIHILRYFGLNEMLGSIITFVVTVIISTIFCWFVTKCIPWVAKVPTKYK